RERTERRVLALALAAALVSGPYALRARRSLASLVARARTVSAILRARIPVVAAALRARAALLVARAGVLRALAVREARSLARRLPVPATGVPRVPLPTLSVRGVRFVTAVLTLTFVFATAIGTTGLVAQRGTVALGASTTLTIIAGEVSIGDGSGTFAPARDGDVLQAGMVVRTGPASYAILTYFEGSSVSLEPETELVIEALQANPDGSTIVGMRQRIGKTWHAVAKLLRADSKYEVRTPTGVASVRGTAFEVDVVHDERGEVISIVTTAEGAVATAKEPTPDVPRPPEVIVPAGFQATVRTTEPIEPPQRAPEPQRKVTVTVEAESSIVIDSVGRANGIRDGKVVLQTPGAKVEKVNGKLVVTLPRIPDGKVTTVVDRASAPEVRITTTVTELGKGESTVTERVPAPDITRVVTGVELKRQEQGGPTELRRLGESEKRDAPAPKLPEPPKPPEPPKREPPKPEERGGSDKDKEQAPGDVGGKQVASGFV
ncbi:MAG: FecR domain-containing protein, partial [Chloroflexota bacterium]